MTGQHEHPDQDGAGYDPATDRIVVCDDDGEPVTVLDGWTHDILTRAARALAAEYIGRANEQP